MRWWITIGLLGMLATPATAHQSSIKYVDVTVADRRARVAFTVDPADVTEAIGRPPDARPTVDEAAVPAAAAYVRDWLALSAGSLPCTAGAAGARPDASRRFVFVEWTVTCAVPIDELRVDLRRFFELDVRHEAILTVHAAGERGKPAVARAADPVLVLRAGEGGSFAAWIADGMHHIHAGLDHVCFVLALIVVIVLVRTPAGWQVRPPLATLRATAVIVTGFTIAHSVSLIAASLGWVELPSRVVESLIAASIVYTAIENTIVPDARWRFGLTVGFGLVHGLGFASMLADRLPADDVVLPLVGFNLGVELGQLTIVTVALPACWFLARGLGAARYRRRVLPIAAVPLVLVGIKWLIERAFDLAP